MRSFPAFVLAALAASSFACGYRFVVPGAEIPAAIDTIYVERMEANQADPEIVDSLAREMRRVIRRDGRFTLTEDAAAADAVLRVGMASLLTRPVAFDRFDQVLDYETTIRISASLMARGGQMLWRSDDLGATRSHAADPGAVVTTSSGFQSSERLRAGDLEDYDPVQLGEARELRARQSIAADLATAIYASMMEGR